MIELVVKMEIPSHPGRWENVFRSNLYLRLAESTKKKYFVKKVVLSKILKSGGKKLVYRPTWRSGVKFFWSKIYLGGGPKCFLALRNFDAKQILWKKSFFQKIWKRGGEKMVITGHPWWLGKIFFGQNVTWACGISMQKIFFEKKQLLGSYGTFTLFSV